MFRGCVPGQRRDLEEREICHSGSIVCHKLH